MPWCDSCDVYLAPNTVSSAGACPTCESEVDGSDLKNEPTDNVPWHFWVMVVALVAYLGWRVIDGVGWLFEQI